MPNKPSSNSSQAASHRFNKTRSHQLAVLWLGVVVFATLLLVKQWGFSSVSPIETDILKLLPVNEQNPIAESAFDKVTTSLSDKVVFVLSADSPAGDRDKALKTTKDSDNSALYQAAQTFTNQLKNSGYFANITAEIDAKQQQQWAQYYFQHRWQQLTSAQRARLEDNPSAQTQRVIQSVYNPFAGVTGQELANDPFLLFRDYLSQISHSSSSFGLTNGYLTTQYQDKTYLLITAELNDSPYSMQAQQAVPLIEQWQQNLTQHYQVDVAHTGVLFYADFGTRSAKSEISTIGVFSLLGVVLLIAMVFRSLTPLALALLSVSIGLLVAMAVTTFVFGRVHLFSLVFGASLIGVSIDYAFHFLTDRLAAGNKWDSLKGLKHIFIAITLGLMTSLIGYLGLFIAPFPGLQQLALFSAIGLISAYATVVAWYPILARSPSKPRQLPGQQLSQLWLTTWQNRFVSWGLPSAILFLSLFAMTHVRYNDDIHQLQAMPAALKQQETLIATLTGMQSSQQMLVVTADDNEALLQSLESLESQLNDWQDTQIISGYQSLHRYLPSQQRQVEDFTLIQSLYLDQGKALAKALHLTRYPKIAEQPTLVTLPDYLQHPVSEPLRFLYLGEIEGQVASVILLKDVSDAAIVKALSTQQPQITYLNKAEEVSELFGQYRIKIMELLALAIFAIAVILVWRYDIKRAIRILLPSLIACLAGLAVTAATGSELNLFNLLALVLIIGIGIDYTLFFAEQQRCHSTLLAITLSAITTLLSFGLLSLSDTHAIHSFGITVLTGIFIAWLLSPLAIDLVQSEHRESQ
ncbi:MMPL family transporter [Vibrio sp. ZSDZ65]|uniref:MMPL family transporter n=1 Tax=Vibrio qingdaonensis TaxID=2829491 RepID=A0A9X3CJX8_9VIBR|nr:MMPL family transporter [Vibrio qingdaonensis]MCW8344832.1 MMPL family transporter [Vibrio qingdaonensis]